MPIEDKSVPFKFFITFRTLFPSFRLENLTMTIFGPLLDNQWQSSMLEESSSTSSFLNNWRAVLPVLSFRLTRAGHLVLNITVWSTDSYSSSVISTKQIAPSVLSWLFWRSKVLTAFSHSLRSDITLFIFVKAESELFWYSRAKVITSSFDSFFSADSDNGIV